MKWCNTHQRAAERCKTEGGILLPCVVVDLTGILEIEDDVSKFIDLHTTTAASGAPPDGKSPMFETTLVETLAIRKFVEMSIADIRAQLERAAKDGTPRKLFLAQKQNGYVITAWLTSALMTVDAMLGEAAARSTTPLAQELRDVQDPS